MSTGTRGENTPMTYREAERIFEEHGVRMEDLFRLLRVSPKMRDEMREEDVFPVRVDEKMAERFKGEIERRKRRCEEFAEKARSLGYDVRNGRVLVPSRGATAPLSFTEEESFCVEFSIPPVFPGNARWIRRLQRAVSMGG